MRRLEQNLYVGFLTLAVGTMMILPSSKAIGSQRQTPQHSDVEEVSVPFDGILRYISSGWDSLTRSLNSCKTFEDTKTEGERILY